jgi:hypothetical protein
VIAQKTIATPRASCNEIEPSPCWKNMKEDSEFEEVILFLEKSVSGFVCIEVLLIEMETPSYHLKNTSHMRIGLRRFPRE